MVLRRKKWVIGSFNDLSHTTDRFRNRHGYASSAEPAEWPHHTHDWVLSDGSKAIKVYSVATKESKESGVVSLIEDKDPDDERLLSRTDNKRKRGEDSDDGAARGAQAPPGASAAATAFISIFR